MYSSVVIGMCPKCEGLVLNAFHEDENGSTYNNISMCTRCHEGYTGKEKTVITNIPTHELRTNVGRINNLLASFSDESCIRLGNINWEDMPSAKDLRDGTSGDIKYLEIFNETRPMIDAAIVNSVHEELFKDPGARGEMIATIELDPNDPLTEDRIKAVTLVMMSDKYDDSIYTKAYKNTKYDSWVLEIALGKGLKDYRSYIEYNKFGIVTKRSLSSLVTHVLDLQKERKEAYAYYKEDIKGAFTVMTQRGEKEAFIRLIQNDFEKSNRSQRENNHARLIEYLESKGYSVRVSDPDEEGNIYLGVGVN